VFVGNNANVLGNIIIGENSRVGAGSVVLRDVPPNSTVVGVPAHVVYRDGERVLITDPHEIKDPLSDALIALAKDVEELKAKVAQREGVPATADATQSLQVEDLERAAYRTEQELEGWYGIGGGI
jgi:serine O-acetyltransferase